MKKLFSLILIVGFVLSLSTFSFAETVFTTTGPDTAKTGVLNDFKASNKVEVHGLGNTIGYAATSGHLNGDKLYGSASNDSIIYKADRVAGEATIVVPGASDSSAFVGATGWSPL